MDQSTRHIGIAGNDRADQLAEEGRKASLLSITARGRVPRPMTPLHTPPQRPRVEPDDVVFIGVEVTPLCCEDICTPIALCARGRELDQPPSSEDAVRRLFVRALGESDREDAMCEDRLVSSPVSSIESPDCMTQSDYDTSGENSEFSTDISSTRKRQVRNLIL